MGEGLTAERDKLVDFDSNQPMIQLQRAREVSGIRDIAPCLRPLKMEKLLALIKDLVREDCERVRMQPERSTS